MKFTILVRCVPAILLVALAVACWPAFAADGQATFARDVQPLLKQHCFACHGPDEQEARIQYDNIDGYRIEQQHLWTKVHEILSTGEMPPEDRPQPTDDEKQKVLRWIEQESAAAQLALGTGSLRRLNRRELSAALQDLTGLSVHYADMLPGDGTVDGFDTGAEGLQDAADSIAATMRVSRRAVDAIYFLEKPESQIIAVDFREVKDARRAFDAYKEQGVAGKVRGDILPNVGLLTEPKWVGEKGGQEIYVPAPADRRGVLRLKLQVAAFKPLEGIPNPHLWVEMGAKDIDFREITGTPDAPQVLIYEVQMDELAIESKGLKIALSNKVEVPYGIEGFENDSKLKPDEKIPGGPGLFRPAFDKKKLKPAERPIPFVALQKIEVEIDYVAAWPPESWNVGRALLPVRVEDEDVDSTGKSPRPTWEDREASAKKLLDLWIERAWRRPVSEAEQERFLSLFNELRKQEMSFDEALCAAFQAVLLSGPFRYLESSVVGRALLPVGDDDARTGKSAGPTQYAIASRLSFMLWGGPPDEELLQLAGEGKLRDPKVLDAQVDRLLDDPRSDAFVRPFVTQWLVLDQPITLVMDYIQQQDFRFGRYLKESMREETIQYIAQMLKENRPAKELIDSDWTMMNNALAIHYGYDNIDGGKLRKVKLRRDAPRGGGILSHAGIQSMLCWMGENWVIYRGAWALRHILNDPPPPPPLEVPELIPSDGANRGKTFRELLVQHQEDKKCTVCHTKMDPLGFAFQNFDLSGRWRDVEFEKYVRNEIDGKIEWRGEGKTRPVDSTGQLPRGEKYTTFAECKTLIVENYLPDLVGGLLKNLMLYATGRQADVEDMAEIRAIVAEQKSRGYPLRDLVKAVVRSKAFLEH